MFGVKKLSANCALIPLVILISVLLPHIKLRVVLIYYYNFTFNLHKTCPTRKLTREPQMKIDGSITIYTSIY